jgi:hypothetical protein
MLLRGLTPHLPEGATVLAMERGKTDAIGLMRKCTAVLTDDDLLLAIAVRTRTILTVVPRRDIRSVDVVAPNLVTIVYEDYERAIQREVQLDLRRKGDREGIIATLSSAGDAQS